MKSPIRKPRAPQTPAAAASHLRIPRKPGDIKISVSVPTGEISPTGHLVKKKIKLWPRPEPDGGQ
jgi:hypothetical protein